MVAAIEPRGLDLNDDLQPQQTEESEDFEYQPLPDAARYLRLIEIQPAESDDEPIECTLSAWQFLNELVYNAISYTWGSPSDLTTISVNGARLVVRQNCKYVLRQARKFALSRYIWIDTICINQQDVEEKSHQVGMMGKVFDLASHILACVGSHAHDSEFTMQILGEIKPTAFLGKSMSRWPRHRFFCHAMRWIFTHQADVLARISKAAQKLLRRPYFARLWIIQEVFMKQAKASLVCGFNCQPFASLFVLRFIFQSASLSVRGIYGTPLSQRPSASPIKASLDSLCGDRFDTIHLHWMKLAYPGRAIDAFLLANSFSGKRRQNIFAAETGASGTSELHTVVAFTKDFHCEEPKDFIYGTLPLVDWGQACPIVPDYHKTTLALALEVFERWRGEKFVNVYHLTVLAARLGLGLEDEQIAAAVTARRDRATDCRQYGMASLVQGILPHRRSEQDLLLLKDWHAEPLFDERPGYHVQLDKFSEGSYRLSQHGRQYDSLNEYRIRIDDCSILDDRDQRPLNVGVSMLVYGDVQIGDWMIYPNCQSSVFIVRQTMRERYEIVSHGVLFERRDCDGPHDMVSIVFPDVNAPFNAAKMRGGFDVWLDVEYALLYVIVCNEFKFEEEGDLWPLAHLVEWLTVPVAVDGDVALARLCRRPETSKRKRKLRASSLVKRFRPS